MYLLQGLTLGFTASATPGPFLAYLLSQTLKNGWKRTLPATLAPLLSDGPIIALVLLILTQTPTWLLKALQIAGGIFILYLARGAYLSFKHFEPDTPYGGQANRKNLFEATIMNLLNPNPYIFWGSVGGPLLLKGWRESPAHGAIFILGFYLLLVGGFVGFTLLFGTTRRLGPKVSRILSGISAVVLLLFGLYQLGTGIVGLTS